MGTPTNLRCVAPVGSSPMKLQRETGPTPFSPIKNRKGEEKKVVGLHSEMGVVVDGKNTSKKVLILFFIWVTNYVHKMTNTLTLVKKQLLTETA